MSNTQITEIQKDPKVELLEIIEELGREDIIENTEENIRSMREGINLQEFEVTPLFIGALNELKPLLIQNKNLFAKNRQFFTLETLERIKKYSERELGFIISLLKNLEISNLLAESAVSFDQILQLLTMDEYYYFEEHNRLRDSLNLEKVLQDLTVLQTINSCADNLQAESEAESMVKIEALRLKMGKTTREKYKNLFDRSKISLGQLLQIKNCIQLSALNDDLIMKFVTMEGSVINVDWLLKKVDNLFQVNIIKEAHIQALLTDGTITPDQLLNIKDRRSYEALMNPLIAKILREKPLAFDDIIENKDVGKFGHCTVSLDEFVRLCSGGSETVPLWFKSTLHANGIEIFVTDTEFFKLTHASMRDDGLTRTTKAFKAAYSKERQSFTPLLPLYEPDSSKKQLFGSICTIYALDSNKRLLGYSILSFYQPCVHLDFLASASKAKEVISLGSEDIFCNIGTILFDASRIACVNKDFEWHPTASALPFYEKKIAHDGIAAFKHFEQYEKYFKIEKADVSRIRSYLYKNEIVDLQELPVFIVNKHLDLAERRGEALKNVPEAKPQSVDMPISEEEKMQNITKDAKNLVFMKKNFQIFTANTRELIAKRKSSSQPEKQKENLQENSEVASIENAEENSATQSKPE